MRGSWGKPHNEKLCNLYFSPNVITMTKSRRMSLAGEKRNANSILARGQYEHGF
jgi:hypothetical protein